MKNIKITALIPCRKGSERIPNKNTKLFANSSLLEIKLNQLIQTEEISKIIVSTDDPMVLKIAASLKNDKIIIHKREGYSTSSECTTDELIKYFCNNLDVDGYLLWTHVTSPFINSKMYSKAIKSLIDNPRFDSLVSVTILKEFLWDKNGNPLNYGTYTGRWPKSQTLEPVYHINSGIFLIDMKKMRELKDRVGKNPMFFETEKFESLDIDYPEDFDLCEKIYEIKKKEFI